jgi:hypothetical protein
MWLVVSIRPDGSHGHVWSRHRLENRAKERRSDLRIRSGIRGISVVFVPDASPKGKRPT